MKSHSVLLCPAWDINHPFVQHILPIRHLIANSVIRWTVPVLQCLCLGYKPLGIGFNTIRHSRHALGILERIPHRCSGGGLLYIKHVAQREQKQEELQSCSLWNENHIHRKIDKMKRQRTMYQMKEQDKTPEKQLNELEIGNLPKTEFRIMIVKMIQHLGKRMEAKINKMQGMFNKDLEELKNKQTEKNNTITEMKNTLEGINSRITEAEEQISDLEDRMVAFTAAEKNKEKRMKRNEDRASLLAQWLRICLPVQGTRVRALVWEDPTCRGTTGPVSHNY